MNLIIWSIGFNCSDLLLVATWQSAIHALYGIHKVNSSLELRFYSLSHGKREYLLRAEGKNDILQKKLTIFFLLPVCTLHRILKQLFSPIFFTVGKDSKMKRGLPQITKEHPILFIGNHTFVGLDLAIIVNAFLEDQNVMIRSLAHPALTAGKL